MKRYKLGFDMDETVSDLVYQTVKVYNKTYRQELNYYKIDQYDITPFIVPECKNIWKEFCTPQFLRELHVEPSAVGTLSKLAEDNDIYFVTAGHPNTMSARDQWLSGHFPFYKSRMLIGCREKQLLRLDWLVDDYEGNLIGGEYRGILVNRPWNRKFNAEEHGIKRVTFLDEILDIIK